MDADGKTWSPTDPWSFQSGVLDVSTGSPSVTVPLDFQDAPTQFADVEDCLGAVFLGDVSWNTVCNP